MKTSLVAKEKTHDKKWYIVDANGATLGRLATRVATILMGKNKVNYTPHINCGDNVVVINAKDVCVKGSSKPKQKIYKSYSAYPGGLNITPYERMIERRPEFVIRHAVKGMLPKNKLANQMLKRLRVYKDENHTQIAQKPEKIEITCK